MKLSATKRINVKRFLLRFKIGALNFFRVKYTVLLGTPRHTNIGDRAIAYAEKLFVKKYVGNLFCIELPYEYPLEHIGRISAKAVIALHGGGNLGDIWLNEEEYRREIIKKYKNNRMVLFPQTVFFENKSNLNATIDIYSSAKNLTLIAREETSYAFLKENFHKNNTLLTPDIVMSLSYSRVTHFKREDSVMFMLRADKERTIDAATGAVIEKYIQKKLGINTIIKSDMYTPEEDAAERSHESIVKAKLNEIAKSKVVITDRLHGMIFCLITGTPCIVLDSKTHKTSGVYKWIEGKDIEYIKLCSNADESIKELEKMKKGGVLKEQLPYNPLMYSIEWDKIKKVLKTCI